MSIIFIYPTFVICPTFPLEFSLLIILNHLHLVLYILFLSYAFPLFYYNKISVECSISASCILYQNIGAEKRENCAWKKSSRPAFDRSAAFDAFLRISPRNLFSGDCTGGASALASAAIDASVCVHNCNATLNGDCTNGASALASAAANTCVRNLVCHNKTLLYFPCQCLGDACPRTVPACLSGILPCLHSSKPKMKRQD